MMASHALGSRARSQQALAWAQRVYDTVPIVPTAGCDSPRDGFTDAYDAARQVIREYGPDYDRQVLRGQCEMRLGKYAKAVTTFAASAKLRPQETYPKQAVVKARQYFEAASLLASLDRRRRQVLEVVRIFPSAGPKGANTCWLGVLAGEKNSETYGRDDELDIFSNAGHKIAGVVYSLDVEEVGEFYSVCALNLAATGKVQIVFRGVHRLGDGSRRGRVVVFGQVDGKWGATFDRSFFGTAWISDFSRVGRWSILVENPLYWRASASWTDVYDFRGRKWIELDADHRSFYAEVRDKLKRDLREVNHNRRVSRSHRAVIQEAIRRANAILSDSKASNRQTFGKGIRGVVPSPNMARLRGGNS